MTPSAAVAAKQQELEQLQEQKRLLTARSSQEKVELNLPKTAVVELVDVAAPKPVTTPSFTDRLRGSLAREVTETATVRVQRDLPERAGLSGQPAIPGAYDPFFIETETRVLKSELVLDKVIDKLNLNSALGRRRW